MTEQLNVAQEVLADLQERKLLPGHEEHIDERVGQSAVEQEIAGRFSTLYMYLLDDSLVCDSNTMREIFSAAETWLRENSKLNKGETLLDWVRRVDLANAKGRELSPQSTTLEDAVTTLKKSFSV